MFFKPDANEEIQVPRHALMFHVGRCRHVVLAVDQLVPLPVVREQQEVVVGELHARTGWIHVVAPMPALTVAPFASVVPGASWQFWARICGDYAETAGCVVSCRRG